MEITKTHLVGMGIGVLILGGAFALMHTKFFFFIAGIGVLVMVAPFIFSLISESKAAEEKEEMFLEFARGLVESVKTGTPISKSILNVKNKPFGVLSIHIEKLANQIAMGIPLNNALRIFANDIGNKTISRAITLIGQAERAGGNIGEILESVTGAVSTSDKLKKERKSAISTLVVQGYIIFIVFLVIILILQFQILPIIENISDITKELDLGREGGVGGGDISGAFLYLLLIQGFFGGLVIGKLSEGSIKAGLKHSFALMLMSFLVSSGANILWG